MTKYKNKFRVESSRLSGWNYSCPWFYFVTIRIEEHSRLFGEIKNGRVILNELGKIADWCWNEIPQHFKNVKVDSYIIMPNHIHGIINILDADGIKFAKEINPDSVETPYMASPLGDIIGKFKGAVTRSAKNINYNDFKWQTRYYDRVIRDEKELFYIRNYIEINPLKASMK